MDWEQHYRQLSRVYSAEYPQGRNMAVGGFLSDTWDILTDPIDEQVANYEMAKQDLLALNEYMHRQTLNTAEGKSLASDWSRWWDTTGNPANYSLRIPPAVWDEARNRKLKFDLANAVSQKEKEHIINVATTGMSTEQMRGLPDRRDPTTGGYYVPPEPPPPMFPPWVKPLALGAAALGLGLSVVPMLRKLILHV